MGKNNYICLLLLFVLGCQPAKKENKVIEFSGIPQLQEISGTGGVLDVSSGLQILIQNEALQPLQQVIREDYYLLTGKELENKSSQPKLSLSLDKNLPEEGYQLKIDQDIELTGGSYQAVAYGLTTLWQMLDDKGQLARMTTKDQPKFNYRSLMIDCARGWHPIKDLKKIITLARWYKIRYIHLHLTDDQLFTFQSEKYPLLATKDRSYSKQALKELNQYAYERGVVLIPEIDVPAHASQFTKKMPELFGIADLSKNSYTMSLGKEQVYNALDTLFGELAEVFTYTPFLHIGGDEAHFAGMKEDPETQAYMKKQGLESLEDLYRHFIVRMNKIVKKHGKKTLVWAGFKRDNKGEKVKIPKEVTVMAWESEYYDPNLLLADGYPVINASFKPLYIVNNRKWPVEYIYTSWNEKRWEYGTNFAPQFQGTETKTNKGILGASLCAWEQSTLVELRRARKRMAAFGEKMWGTASGDFVEFEARMQQMDQKLDKILYAFQLSEKGLSFASDKESNFYEHLRFKDTLVINATARYKNLTLRYDTTGKSVTTQSPVFTQPIVFKKNGSIRIQAFDTSGKAVGQQFYKKYYLYPLQAVKRGLEADRMPTSWQRLRFEDSLLIELKSPYSQYQIVYTLHQTGLKEKKTGTYTQPLKIDRTTHLSAKLIDKDSNQVGSTLNESYYLLKVKKSLTTGKKVTASNEHLRPKMAELATNGRVSLWEHWSDLTKEQNWIKVDLGKEETVKEFKVHFFWDNYRYYQYTIETSTDGKNWEQVVDASKQTTKASMEGYQHSIPARKARFLRLNVLHNSANPGLHVTEFSAF